MISRKAHFRWFMVLLVSVGVAYITGRSRSLPVAPNVPVDFDPVAFGLEGKRFDVHLDMVPLKKAFAEIEKLYQVKFQIDWPSIESADADAVNKSLDLHLTQAQLCDVLDALRKEVHDLNYTVHDGVILVGSTDSLSSFCQTRIYDMRPIYECVFAIRLSYKVHWMVGEGYAFFAPDEKSLLTSHINTAIYELIKDAFGDNFDLFGSDSISYSSHDRGGYIAVHTMPYQHIRLSRLLNCLTTTPNQPVVTTQPPSTGGGL